MDVEVVDWSRWTRIQRSIRDSEKSEEVVTHLDLLSLRSCLSHMRVESISEELRSKVQILWRIGCEVIPRYEFGNECIEMMGLLAYFNSTAVDARVFDSGREILMLKDLGFLTMKRNQSAAYMLISTKFPALMDEIRQKNLSMEKQFLRTIIKLLSSCKIRLQGNGWYWHEPMTPIWQRALTHGIRFIRHFKELWEVYLIDLFRYELHGLNDGQKEVLAKALEIFDVKYGNMGWKTMTLRFSQLRLLLRGDVNTFLHQSNDFRLLLETGLMTSHEPWIRDEIHEIPSRHTMNPMLQWQENLAEWIYERALGMNDLNSKALLFQESLAYCILGNNVWKSTIPDNDGDMCLSWRLKCLVQLRRFHEMPVILRETREILIRRPFSIAAIPWFSDAILPLAQDIDGKQMILNELSIFLNHLYHLGNTEFCQNYLMERLMKCECDLENWDRFFVIMREQREYSPIYPSLIPRSVFQYSMVFLEKWVQLESALLFLVKNSRDDRVDELVNESLQFTKQLVELRLSNGAYGEKDRVDRSPIDRFKYDPLVQVIRTCFLRNRHEELLSYVLEYEKLLENNYGERLGPITNGILVFGEWFRAQLKDQENTGETFKALLQGVKTTTQNRIAIILKQPTEKKSWMEGYADLISRDCDFYLLQN